MQHHLTSQSYGKCGVRLSKVIRTPNQHSILEMTVDIELDGRFEAAYKAGDNRLVVPTDTMKNTVYALARQHEFFDVESFGRILTEHFIHTFEHVSRATARLTEHEWKRLEVGGSQHPHTFVGGGSEVQKAVVVGDRTSLSVSSGLEGLVVLKTTGSGFSGFLKDRYTTLQDTGDRILATTVSAEWCYDKEVVNWSECRPLVREALLGTFAQHESSSVQHTLFAMATAVFDACDEVESITLSMPNQHRLLVDLSRFGLENRNDIFLTTSEPYGMIRASIQRGSRA